MLRHFSSIPSSKSKYCKPTNQATSKLKGLSYAQKDYQLNWNLTVHGANRITGNILSSSKATNQMALQDSQWWASLSTNVLSLSTYRKFNTGSHENKNKVSRYKGLQLGTLEVIRSNYGWKQTCSKKIEQGQGNFSHDVGESFLKKSSE